MKLFKKQNIVIAVALLLSACGTVRLYEPNESNVTKVKSKDAAVDINTLTIGKNLFETKCSACHRLYAPSTKSDVQWAKVLDWMQPNAKITDAEKHQIYLYVISHP
jgi:cytochrome c5